MRYNHDVKQSESNGAREQEFGGRPLPPERGPMAAAFQTQIARCVAVAMILSRRVSSYMCGDCSIFTTPLGQHLTSPAAAAAVHHNHYLPFLMRSNCNNSGRLALVAPAARPAPKCRCGQTQRLRRRPLPCLRRQPKNLRLLRSGWCPPGPSAARQATGAQIRRRFGTACQYPCLARMFSTVLRMSSA